MSLEVRRIQNALLAWYDRRHRKLPWRAEPGRLPDPYHVLVSEAMLQQTQVATVVNYFNRFIDRWPAVEDLAAADEQDVLHLWQGLGYYRRARHLHAAARTIVEQHDGRIPRDVKTLLKLPGVGAYTAGALASIAHGQSEPVVDGNVVRVLARWFTMDGGIDNAAGRRRFWDQAEAMVCDPKGFTCGDWNQAVMELGARVCLPRGPECEACPVSQWCGAYRQGVVEQYPTPRARTVQKSVVHRIAAVQRGNRWLIRQRPNDGLWAGMWELVTQETDQANGQPTACGLRRWVRRETGIEPDRMKLAGTFDHQTTHRRIRFELWVAPAGAGRLRQRAGRWCDPSRLSDLAMSNPQRRAVRMLQIHK